MTPIEVGGWTLDVEGIAALAGAFLVAGAVLGSFVVLVTLLLPRRF